MKVTYKDLDPVLEPWSGKHGLHVFTQNRDWETREISIVDDAGNIINMGIHPSESNQISITVSSKSNRHFIKHYQTSFSEYEETLEKAFLQAIDWIELSGNTRTPV